MTAGAVPAAYADAIHLKCQACGAEPNTYCTFTTNSHTFYRHIPCLQRGKAAR